MPQSLNFTWTTALILHSVASGRRYGYEVMDATGLPSGTVYPALRRLENAGLLESRVEADEEAFANQRPARRYYELRSEGDRFLAEATERFTLLRQLRPERRAQ
jgi:PadR family transcriptional regulator PadR